VLGEGRDEDRFDRGRVLLSCGLFGHFRAALAVLLTFGPNRRLGRESLGFSMHRCMLAACSSMLTVHARCMLTCMLGACSRSLSLSVFLCVFLLISISDLSPYPLKSGRAKHAGMYARHARLQVFAKSSMPRVYARCMLDMLDSKFLELLACTGCMLDMLDSRI
jgi:hypothetical protein